MKQLNKDNDMHEYITDNRCRKKKSVNKKSEEEK